MSLVGKIQSLFLDREKTQPIFPITKVKAVSDENGVGLNVLLEDKASKSFVTNKIAEAQLGGDSGEIDLSGYATKDDIKAIDFPVDSINGKTGAVQLSATDVGAKPSDWMPTAEQVGAHPDTWLPTPAQIGAATLDYANACFLPSGKHVSISSVEDLDGIQQNGAFRLASDPQIVINGIRVDMLICFVHNSSGVITQYALSYNGHMQVRSCWYGAWYPWKLVYTSERPPTLIELGAAPASATQLRGFLDKSTDFNTVKTPGYYWVSTWSGSGGANYPINRDAGFLNVYSTGGAHGGEYIHQEYYSSNYGTRIYRFGNAETGGYWKAWEYENPPMELGVEYCTTERHNGKPVYAFHGSYLSQTELSSGQTIMIPTGIANMADCFNCSAKIGDLFIPVGVIDCRTSIFQVVNGEIQLTNNSGYYGAGFTVRYTLYYTKTTD